MEANRRLAGWMRLGVSSIFLAPSFAQPSTIDEELVQLVCAKGEQTA
jgi:hypothetical protein